LKTASTFCDRTLFIVITLTVIAYNEAPADGTLQVHFDELGGSIGRADNNQLVLPDPERVISRVAAQVVYRNGAFAIVDRGSNPIKLNGQALASGREMPLAPGDVLHVGGYALRATAGGSSPQVAKDPFADLLGPAIPAPRGGHITDPLANFGMASRPAPLSPPPAPAASPAPSQFARGIPKDWDPFAAHTTNTTKPGAAAPGRQDAFGLDLGAAAPAALVPGLDVGSAASSSLDQMFGLSPSVGGDPLANSMLDAPMAQPNMAAHADPVRSLGTAPRATAAALPDQLPDLHRAFIPPTTIKPPRPVAAPAAVTARVPASAPTSMPSPAARPVASQVASPVANSVANSVASAHAAKPEQLGALLEALRRGLGASALDLPALTPEVMELIGQLLREAVAGTVDLLRDRNTVKHELRAQVTTIGTKSNNPLKFSPSVEVALAHLLAPPKPGFIAAAPALHDAYDDLRAHHFAFVVGMQAVVEASLQRFDPTVLESQLGDRSLFQSLLPTSRSARLWEQFVDHHAQIRQDATDDFHTLFGRVFLKAYDDHVESLQSQRNAARKGR
jgi:FHA domain-containing protein